MSNLQRNLIVFGRLLRRAGIDVHVGRMIDVTDALQHVDVGSRDEVYHTCRALLVHRHDQLAVFDRAFDMFWRDADRRQHLTCVAPRGREIRESRPGADRVAVARRGRSGGRGHVGASADSDVERRRGARRQGLRGIHRRRSDARASRAGAAGVESWRAADAAMDTGARLARRSAARAGAQPAHRWRRDRAAAADAARAAAADRAAVRRQRIDGALLADAPALRARADADVSGASKPFCSRPS